MPAPTPSIDPSTLKFARTLVHIKARQITRRAPGDRDDVEQTLLLEILLRWPGYDAARGTREAFVEQIVRGKVCKMMRDRTRAKRDWRREQVLDLHAHDRPDPADRLREVELRADVGAVVSDLPEPLREACDQLQRESISAVARGIGTPRSTLDSALRRSREAFRRADLDGYLS